MLRRHRQEAEAIELRHRFDREAPIGTALRDRSGDRIVRFRLIGVSRRPRTIEQLVDQDARASAGIAVDHQRGGIGQNDFQRFLRAAALKSRITGPEQYALHPPPPGTRLKPGVTRCLLY